MISDCRLAMDVLSDCSEINAKLMELHRKTDELAELSRKAIQENARVAHDQDEFNECIKGYQARHRVLMEQINELEGQKHERQNRRLELKRLIFELASWPLVIDAFDERLWMVAVERVTVGVDGGMVFWFWGL